MAHPFRTPLARGTLAAVAGLALLAPAGGAQVGVRAVGAQTAAADSLGRYLAQVPDDGAAWLALGRLHLMGARLVAQAGDPDVLQVTLQLDFAAAALDQAVQLKVDSARVMRGYVEMERVRLALHDERWSDVREQVRRNQIPSVQEFILEFGRNLLQSCPANGLLVTGHELESLAVWYEALYHRTRRDVLPVRADLFLHDPGYRAAVARELEVNPALDLRDALAVVGRRRPVCVSATVDQAALPDQAFRVYGLARTSWPVARDRTELELDRLRETMQRHPSPWTREVLALYAAALRRNPSLCRPLWDLPGGPFVSACPQLQ